MAGEMSEATGSLTGKLIERVLAKPLALALTVLPSLTSRSCAPPPLRARFALLLALCGAWYLTLATLFQ